MAVENAMLRRGERLQQAARVPRRQPALPGRARPLGHVRMTVPIRRRAGVGAPTREQLERASARIRGFTTLPFAGVEWSLSYAAFLAYSICIITFRFPVGTESMAIALLTLPLERRALRLPLMSVLTFALVGWALVGVLTTAWPEVVITNVNEFAKICAVVFVGVNVLNTRARLRMFMAVSTAAFMLFPVKGSLINYFFNNNTVQGRAIWGYIYSNPNDLAGLALLQLSLVLAAMEVERQKYMQFALRLSVVLLVLVIFLTQSRGAFIATVAFVLFSGRHYMKQITVKNFMALMALAAIVFVVAPESAWKRFSTITYATDENAFQEDDASVDFITRSDQGSSQQRLAIWKVARAIIADNAVTGVGLGAYPLAHFEMQQQSGMPATARGKRDTHSTYLKLMAEVGLIGFAIFMAIVIVTLRTGNAAVKATAKTAPAFASQVRNLQVGLYAYMVAGIWGSYGTLVATYMHMVLIVVTVTILNEERAAGGPGVLRPELPFRTSRRPPMAAAGARS